MSRVYQYYQQSGHLFPYDIRFDPNDIAHCERLDDGRVRFRIITELGFTEAVVVRIDGHATEMRRFADDNRSSYWEAIVDTEGATFNYTFALRFGADLPVYLVPAGISNAAERLDFWTLEVENVQRTKVPDWARGAVIYQIFPDRFASGNDALTPVDADAWDSPPHSRRFKGGDLYGVADKANHLAGLGVDAVYLNPVFSSPSVHRYDAADYYNVDERLGGNEALSHMVESLHAKDIRVILDASFNHCHPHFFAFQDVVKHGPDSRYWSWFEIHDYPISVKYRPNVIGELYGDRAEHFLDYLVNTTAETGLPLIEVHDDGPPSEPTYASWYGVPTMPRLMLSNPEARQYFLDVATHWINEYGIDGWRMDVARYIDHDFWSDFRATVKAANTDTYLIAEIMGDAMPWLQGDRFDATMNYQFRDLAVDFFAETTITAGHFVDGLIRTMARYAPDVVLASQNLLSSHDTPRFLTMAGGDPRRLSLAVFTQMTIPGAPGLYYGDEVGMTGGEDPGSRGAFPWYDDSSWNQEILAITRQLGQLRRDHPALRTGEFEVVWQSDEAFAFIRRNLSERLLIVINREDDAIGFSIPIESTRPTVIWGDAELVNSVDGVQVSGLAPWSGLIISL